MFTGIVETIGKIVKINTQSSNIQFTIQSKLACEAYIDQSIAHNGVCLTVVDIIEGEYTITAIQETLNKTNLKSWKVDDYINLERAMKSDQRLDGHFVQGHVDGTVQILSIEDANGSWNYRFSLPSENKGLIVNKGSVCLNGISLTVVDPEDDSFGVSIIPYTHEHTTMKLLKEGDRINIEYDMIAKHIVKNIATYMDAYLEK